MVDTPPRSLLARLRDVNDPAAWTEFVTLYEPLLTGYVRGQGVADPQGIVQAVLLAVQRSVPEFDTDQDRGWFRTWLWRTTKIVMAERAAAAERVWTSDDQARRDRQTRIEGRPDPDWDDEVELRVLSFALATVRGRTDPKAWACFDQHFLKGRRAAEVAAAQGLSPANVSAQAARVLTHVRVYLEDVSDE